MMKGGMELFYYAMALLWFDYTSIHFTMGKICMPGDFGLFLWCGINKLVKKLLGYDSRLKIHKMENNSFTFQMNLEITSVYLVVIPKTIQHQK